MAHQLARDLQQLLAQASLTQASRQLAREPQLLLAGIIVPRALMSTWLQWISNVLPASYALEALQQVNAHPGLTGIALRDIIVVMSFAIAALCLAAATLRRRTP